MIRTMQTPAGTTHALVTLDSMPNKALEKEVTIVVEPVEHGEPFETVRGSEDAESSVLESAWKPGFWSQFPWAGFAGLLLVILCSVASLIVVVLSNEKPASEFARGRIAPNVLLTIFNSLSNLALTMAVGQGIAINWWRRALTGGSVKDLHYSWAFSTGISNILKKYKYFNLIALTMLMTKFAVLDGILYQKSIYTYMDIIRPPKYQNHNETINIFTADVFPVTGVMGLNQSTHGLMTYQYEYEVWGWDDTGNDIDQSSVIYDCKGGDCHFYATGAGFSVTCNTTNNTIDYGALANSVSSPNSGNTTALTNVPLFGVNFTRTWPTAGKNYSALLMDVLYAANASEELPNGVCPMTFSKMSCELRPAVLNYKLQYTNGTSDPLSEQQAKITGLDLPSKKKEVTEPLSYNDVLQATLNDRPSGIRLDFDCPTEDIKDEYTGVIEKQFVAGCKAYNSSWNQLYGVQVSKTADIVENFEAGGNSTLEGLYLALMTTLTGQGTISYVNESWHLDEDGMISYIHRSGDPEKDNCAFYFENPIDYVLRSINTLTLMTMQRVGLYYDSEAEWVDLNYPPLMNGVKPADAHYRDIPAIVHYEDVFYGSETKYAWGALAATLVVVACISPIFWGFWQLGRKVSLGPFEIANAFGSPAFQGVKGDHVDDILKSAGRVKVVYGRVEHESGEKLAFKVA